MSPLFDLTGKVAVVTGSSKGIGKAIATRMAEHGAKVVISSRKAEVCQAVADEINARFPGRAMVKAANISRKEELQALADAALKAWGKVDILVCNAAVNPYYGPMLKIGDEAYERTMGANIKSNLWLCNMLLPQMAERKEGVVIIISSIGGLRGTDILGIYSISKAADMQLARNLAVEWGKHNIRANCIAPGLIRTDMARALWENPEIYKKTTRSAPLGRIGEPDEIAGAAIYLASPAGSFATGQTFVVDGGVTVGTTSGE
jgi:NAD(P)-dependent dehydrogenase (short-subunit alcohol dehydrogenase family)